MPNGTLREQQALSNTFVGNRNMRISVGIISDRYYFQDIDKAIAKQINNKPNSNNKV